MLQNIQKLGRVQRLVIFILIFGGILFALVAITLLLIAGSNQRSQAVALSDAVTVREFATLPDNDAYPAAVAVSPDGRVYTGSYVTGALWVITGEGQVREIPGSRDAIGAVAGLTAGPDGSLYIVDQVDADPRTSGGMLRKMLPDGTLRDLVSTPNARGFVTPDDVTLDGTGNVYVSDRGRGEVWRFTPAGEAVLWWTPPALAGVDRYAPTGLAYDATQDAILVTDSTNDTVYRVPTSNPDAADLLYHHGTRVNPPGLDGLTVAPDGAIYVAAMAQNGVARLDGDHLTYIAGLFRGASDVDYSAAGNSLYVSNFDSFSLVVPAIGPRLPFALEVIELKQSG